MKKIRTLFAAFSLLIATSFALLPVATVGAAGALDGACTGNGNTGICQENAKGENANTNSLVNDIVNTLLFIIGAISVLMIIVGGFLYVTSQGDSAGVTKAKNTILYSIVGVVVSFIAYALVNWVFQLF